MRKSQAGMVVHHFSPSPASAGESEVTFAASFLLPLLRQRERVGVRACYGRGVATRPLSLSCEGRGNLRPLTLWVTPARARQ